MNPNEVEKRLREIAERENKATNGPWEFHDSDSNQFVAQPRGKDEIFPICALAGIKEQTENFQFIAHSRQDVPWLLALVKKQREALEKIERYHVPEHVVTKMAQDALNFSPENL